MFGSVHPLIIFFSERGIKNNLFYKFYFKVQKFKLKYDFSWLKRDDKIKKGFIKKTKENENIF